MTDELISRTTRGLFRSLMTGSTVGEIADGFQDEGFAPNPDCSYEDSSVRRQSTQAYLEAVDWSDPGHVTRALRAFGRLMHGFEAQYTENCVTRCAGTAMSPILRPATSSQPGRSLRWAR